MKSRLIAVIPVLLAVFLVGCTKEVPPGTVGRINTKNGWTDEILAPGRHSCWGKDKMYLLDVTNKSFKESLNILVGGKVNLRLDFTVRVRANRDDKEMMKKSFESVPSVHGGISVDQLYQTFLQMKAQAIPRAIYEVQPDVQTAVASSPKLAAEVRRQITEAAKSTPLVVEDSEITNYDWPDSITQAQEDLVKVQLTEAKAEAQVKADLKQAEGRLKVEEANMLVEMKKAEAMAASIDIIKTKLADAPEYLMWHQVRVMGEAAMGPNNCFILYPFATDAKQVQTMLGNANLSQILKPDGPHPEVKKKVPPASAPAVRAELAPFQH